jgi:5-oxopent-3-ene-1,2,5-tricarboxylate decarboxylase / 2-hydroxyhepta-2,4-diene-1,7-dioate isomerase
MIRHEQMCNSMHNSAATGHKSMAAAALQHSNLFALPPPGPIMACMAANLHLKASMSTPSTAPLSATVVSGTIYGVILNDHDSLSRMGAALSDAPYKGTPKAPVLYIKPRNTVHTGAHPVTLPSGASQLEIGATIGIVIGKTAARLTLDNAAETVAGYVLVADLSLPHSSYYRPAIQEKCFDGSCLIAPCMASAATLTAAALSQIDIVTEINDRQTDRRSLGDLLRDVPTLLRDVSEFMTLQRGDMLLVGVRWQAPCAAAGDRVRLSATALGALEFSLDKAAAVATAISATTATAVTAPVRGRIFYNGAIHEVEPVIADTSSDAAAVPRIRLADGRTLAESEAHWLPPVAPGTIFALGLNYADHARELAFKAPEQPLVFLKGPNAVTGHHGRTRRPADATYMHYECELAVVIGKHARNVKRADAYDVVAGYTVANDYAIRDYLENYYRPNLRVKNRDACTPLGPWLVDAASVPDPMKLALSTSVNGKVIQRGNTADMVFDIPALIEYLSAIMTLAPGDIILTGTPEGLADVVAGDCVVTEIEGIGRLVNTIVDDQHYFHPESV